MRIKRFISILCMISLLVSSLATLANAQKVTLTIWDWHAPRMNVLKPQLDKYSKLHPEIEFKTMIVPGDEYWKKILAAEAAGQAPADIIEFHNDRITMYQHVLAPFPEDLFPKSKLRREYVYFDRDFVWKDGKVYFFPGGIMSSLMYYNVDMWDKAGLGAPPKDWEGLRNVAKKLTKYDDKGNLQIAGFAFTGDGYLQWIWYDFFYQQGGYLYSKDGKSADKSWIETPGIKALTFLRDLIFKDKVTKPGFLNCFEAFGTQKAAILYAWTWATGWLNLNYPNIKYGVFIPPSESGSLLPANGRNNWELVYSVPKSVPEARKQEAFKFLRWLYDQDDWHLALNIELGTIPGKKSLWNHSKIVSDPVLSTLAKKIPYTVYPGELPDYLVPIMTDMENRILMGSDPVEVLKITKAEVDKVLKEKPITRAQERRYKPPQK